MLKNINFKIQTGETIAIVGPTGGGKSTVAKLATRFYDPSSGRVLIDGYDIRNVQLESLRKQIGVVPQEPFLFAGSISENVGFSRPEASDDASDGQYDIRAPVAVLCAELPRERSEGCRTYVQAGQSSEAHATHASVL
mgnify:CR=1 FL=1